MHTYLFLQFDYLKSLEIEEKINKIRWCQTANGAVFLLSTNDKTIKFWKVSTRAACSVPVIIFKFSPYYQYFSKEHLYISMSTSDSKKIIVFVFCQFYLIILSMSYVVIISSLNILH